MRVVVQRCQRAKCTVNGLVTGEIQKGFMVLVGFTNGDTKDDLGYIAKKVANLRVFEDENGKMNLSLKDVSGDILSISQFTLYADTKKGNRPSFTNSASGDIARPLYDEFNDLLRSYGLRVETGIFGADMKIDFINDGPVTIIIDSQDR